MGYLVKLMCTVFSAGRRAKEIPGGERVRPAGCGLSERAQRAHDIGHGHQTEDEAGNFIEQRVLREPRRLAELLVLGKPL